MIKNLLILAASLLALLGKCEDDAALLSITNSVIESESAESLGWTRQTLFATEDNRLIDRSGTIVTVADTEAVAVAAAEAVQISEAAITAATNATAVLTSATNGMATVGYGIALSIAPETTRENLTCYVVKEETDGTNDIQYVWYNRSLPLTPIRFVEYAGDIQTNIVKASWVSWSADGETITYNGRTWEGCHKCRIARPSWAVGERCLTLPNDTIGGANGLDLGNATLTVDSVLPFTGVVTNTAYGIWESYNNGTLTERQPL